jgi:hypothetical protein
MKGWWSVLALLGRTSSLTFAAPSQDVWLRNDVLRCGGVSTRVGKFWFGVTGIDEEGGMVGFGVSSPD